MYEFSLEWLILKLTDVAFTVRLQENTQKYPITLSSKEKIVNKGGFIDVTLFQILWELCKLLSCDIMFFLRNIEKVAFIDCLKIASQSNNFLLSSIYSIESSICKL